MTPYNLDLSGDAQTGAPYLTNTFSGDGNSSPYTFSITTARPASSTFTDLLICAWDVTSGGNPTKADYQTDIPNPIFDANGDLAVSLTVNGGDAICTRARLNGMSGSAGFTDYSDLAGAPNGTLCSAGDASTLDCPYVGPTAVSAACALVQPPILPIPGSVAASYTDYGCGTKSGWSYGGVNTGGDSIVLSKLYWFYSGPPGQRWYCYVFNGVQKATSGDFDFDDAWTVKIRVWHCGTYWYTWVNSSGSQPGPPAFGDTPTDLYYGNCGRQADDSGSYVYIDGKNHWWPYVKQP